MKTWPSFEFMMVSIWSTQSMRWIITGAILFNMILKLSVLHNRTYRNLFSILPSLHLITSTAIEHGVFVTAVILGTSPLQLGVLLICRTVFTYMMFDVLLGLWCLPNSRNLVNGQTKFKRKVYAALAFPEIFKVAAVLLQIFDDEPTLLLLIGLLIISIQQISLESVTSISTHKLNTIIFFAVALRFLVRCFFHRLSDVWLLGIVCWKKNRNIPVAIENCYDMAT